MNSRGYIVVFSTFSSRTEAEQIGRKVVEERLAACCNILGGLRSIYRWKGEICEEDEVLGIFKTRLELFSLLQSRIKELHSYEVPEIIMFDIAGGLPEYLSWIDTETSRERRFAERVNVNVD